MERDVKSMREYYESGITKEARWRETQLKALRRFLIEKEEQIMKALLQDLGKHYAETYRDEVIYIYNSL